jgi:hypothetical protein
MDLELIDFGFKDALTKLNKIKISLSRTDMHMNILHKGEIFFFSFIIEKKILFIWRKSSYGERMFQKRFFPNLAQ